MAARRKDNTGAAACGEIIHNKALPLSGEMRLRFYVEASFK